MTDDVHTPAEKAGGPLRRSKGGARLPVGVLLALALAVLVVGGVILFLSASSGTTPATGSTTGGVVTALLLG